MNFSLSFSSFDCYKIGYHMYDKEKYHQAANWLYEATTRFSPSDFYDFIGYNAIKISQLYAEANVKLGKIKNFIVFTA